MSAEQSPRERAITVLVGTRGDREEGAYMIGALERAGLTVVDRDDPGPARRAVALARRLLNTYGTERKGGPLVSRLSSPEFAARTREAAEIESEVQ